MIAVWMAKNAPAGILPQSALSNTPASASPPVTVRRNAAVTTLFVPGVRDAERELQGRRR